MDQRLTPLWVVTDAATVRQCDCFFSSKIWSAISLQVEYAFGRLQHALNRNLEVTTHMAQEQEEQMVQVAP